MKRILYPVAFLALIVVFVVVHSCRSASGPIRVPRLTRSAAAPAASGKIRQQLDAAHASYRRDCLRLQQEFRDSLRPAVAPDYARARDGVEPSVSILSGFGACFKMCCKAVKDQVSGTSEFADAFQEVIHGPILIPCARANRTADDRLQTLKLKLEERRVQYAVEVIETCRNTNVDVKQPDTDLKSLEASLGKSLTATHELQISKVMATVGAAMEVVFIKSTIATLRRVLGAAIAKLAGSSATGAVCAAADGPLPIGDAIGAVLAVGGLAWTAWDIYDACKVLPDKLRAELRDGIDTAERELHKQAEAEADRLTKAYLEAGAEIAAAAGNNI